MPVKISFELEVEDETAAELIGRLLQFGTPAVQEAAVAAGVDPDAVLVPNNGYWTRDMVEMLRKEIQAYPGAVALLDYAAEHADEVVKYSELIDHSGGEARQVAAELGAMSKAARRIFGEKKWPLRAWQAADGEMRYQMPKATADWWLHQP